MQLSYLGNDPRMQKMHRSKNRKEESQRKDTLPNWPWATGSWFYRIFRGNFWNAAQNCLPKGWKEETFIHQPNVHHGSRVAPWELLFTSKLWNCTKWVLWESHITVRLKWKVRSRNPKEGARSSLRSWSKTEWEQLPRLWLELKAGQKASDSGPEGLAI